jgi:hypothetical protein
MRGHDCGGLLGARSPGGGRLRMVMCREIWTRKLKRQGESEGVRSLLDSLRRLGDHRSASLLIASPALRDFRSG